MSWMVAWPGLGVVLAGPPEAARWQQEAAAHFKAGRLAEAAAAYEAAYAADPHPTHLLNLAHAQQRLPQGCGPALATLSRFFARCGDGTCALLSVARERQAELEKACLTEVEVRSDPPGARVQLDQVDAGRTPLHTRLLVDVEHALRVEAPGHTPAERSLKPRPGERLEVEVALRALPAGLTPPTAGAATPAAPEPPVLAWSLVGAGVLALVVGGASTAAAAETVERSEGLEAGETRAHQQLADELAVEQVGMGLGFGLGAALVATGAWLLLGDGPAPTASTGGLGLGLRW